MNVPRRLLSTTLLVILSLKILVLCVYPATAQTDEIASKLQAGNTAVNQAFNAVLDAEKSGANITDLLTQISTAQGMLAQAENSYRTGNTNQAATQADRVLPLIRQITDSAQAAQQTATVSKQNTFNAEIAFTLIGSIVFILVLFQVWRRFRKHYIKNLSESKPEVINQ